MVIANDSTSNSVAFVLGSSTITLSAAAATAATTGNSDPRMGTYYARHSGVAAGVTIRQQFDLLASGFTEGEIDAGTLTLNFSAWIGGEDGVNDGGRPRVNYLDDSLALIGSTETANSIPPAGTS